MKNRHLALEIAFLFLVTLLLHETASQTAKETKPLGAIEKARELAIQAFLRSDVPWKGDFRVVTHESPDKPSWAFMFYNTGDKRRPGDSMMITVDKRSNHLELTAGE